MRTVHSLAVIAGLIASASAQFPPPIEGVTTIQSKFGNGISISYKEVCSDEISNDHDFRPQISR